MQARITNLKTGKPATPKELHELMNNNHPEIYWLEKPPPDKAGMITIEIPEETGYKITSIKF